MPTTTDDLTRHHGGDVVGARLPGDVRARAVLAEALVDRAVQRWALADRRGAIASAVGDLLARSTGVGPVDVCLRLSASHLTVTVAGSAHRLDLAADLAADLVADRGAVAPAADDPTIDHAATDDGAIGHAAGHLARHAAA